MLFRLFKLVIWIIVITGITFWWQYGNFTEALISQDEAQFEVEAGSTFRSVLTEKTGSPLFTKIYLELNPPLFELQAGKYNVSDNQSLEDFISELESPVNEADISLTFLEGWNIFDMDILLSSKGLIQAGEFTSYTTQEENFSGLKADYPFISEAKTLEGFLYPDTYNMNPNSFTVESLSGKMLENFKTKLIDSSILSGKSNTEILDIVSLASIVQKEANKKDNPEEIALIAGILQKRLDEGWQIGADATVCYAHDIATQDCDPTAVLKYLYDDNPYNTRVISGAPAGPIANPEDLVIEATVRAEPSRYYYYLHDNDGGIHYAVTNAEHEGNKAMHLR